MNAMTKVAKMLALMPVVALAAACNGVTPSSFTDVASDAAAAADAGQATSMNLSTRVGCENLSDITLARVDDSRTMVWVEATYHYKVPVGTQQCAAPTWTADRKDLVVDRANRFRAGFPRNVLVNANVTATAPTGLQGTINVNTGSQRASDSVEACKFVDGVNVQVVPVVSPGAAPTVQLVASYRSSQPTDSACTVAPEWTASRRGLVVARDGFHASIGQSDAPTVVSVAAPNGARGEIRF